MITINYEVKPVLSKYCLVSFIYILLFIILLYIYLNILEEVTGGNIWGFFLNERGGEQTSRRVA